MYLLKLGLALVFMLALFMSVPTVGASNISFHSIGNSQFYSFSIFGSIWQDITNVINHIFSSFSPATTTIPITTTNKTSQITITPNITNLNNYSNSYNINVTQSNINGTDYNFINNPPSNNLFNLTNYPNIQTHIGDTKLPEEYIVTGFADPGYYSINYNCNVYGCNNAYVYITNEKEFNLLDSKNLISRSFPDNTAHLLSASPNILHSIYRLSVVGISNPIIPFSVAINLTGPTTTYYNNTISISNNSTARGYVNITNFTLIFHNVNTNLNYTEIFGDQAGYAFSLNAGAISDTSYAYPLNPNQTKIINVKYKTAGFVPQGTGFIVLSNNNIGFNNNRSVLGLKFKVPNYTYTGSLYVVVNYLGGNATTSISTTTIPYSYLSHPICSPTNNTFYSYPNNVICPSACPYVSTHYYQGHNPAGMPTIEVTDVGTHVCLYSPFTIATTSTVITTSTTTIPQIKYYTLNIIRTPNLSQQSNIGTFVYCYPNPQPGNNYSEQANSLVNLSAPLSCNLPQTGVEYYFSRWVGSGLGSKNSTNPNVTIDMKGNITETAEYQVNSLTTSTSTVTSTSTTTSTTTIPVISINNANKKIIIFNGTVSSPDQKMITFQNENASISLWTSSTKPIPVNITISNITSSVPNTLYGDKLVGAISVNTKSTNVAVNITMSYPCGQQLLPGIYKNNSWSIDSSAVISLNGCVVYFPVSNNSVVGIFFSLISTTTQQVSNRSLTITSNPSSIGAQSVISYQHSMHWVQELPNTTKYSNNASVNLSVTNIPSGWQFTGWSCSGTECYSGNSEEFNLTMNNNITETENFAPIYYTLNEKIVSPDNCGSVSQSGNGTYRAGSVVHISATPTQTYPSSGCEFGGWESSYGGGYSGSSPNAAITINSNITETAIWSYSPSQVTMVVNVTPYVTNINQSLIGGYAEIYDKYEPYGTTTCFTSNDTTTGWNGKQNICTMIVTQGNPVTISAVPYSGWKFNGWTGSSYTGMLQSTNITGASSTETAHFIPVKSYYLIINDCDIGVGGWPFCTSPSSGSYSFFPGYHVNINAVSGFIGDNSDYNFANWSGSGAGSYTGPNRSINITMDSNITETAKYQYECFTLALFGSGTQVASPTSSGGCATNEYSGTSVTITATARSGYTFTGWTGSGNGSYTGSANPVTITMYSNISETADYMQS